VFGLKSRNAYAPATNGVSPELVPVCCGAIQKRFVRPGMAVFGVCIVADAVRTLAQFRRLIGEILSIFTPPQRQSPKRHASFSSAMPSLYKTECIRAALFRDRPPCFRAVSIAHPTTSLEPIQNRRQDGLFTERSARPPRSNQISTFLRGSWIRQIKPERERTSARAP